MSMLIFNPIVRTACFVACVSGASSFAFALDGSPTPSQDPVPLQTMSSLQPSLQATNSQSVDAPQTENSMLDALRYAADGGKPIAQFKLGKMYADGVGVPHDDAKAYQYFMNIIDNYDEDAPSRRDMPLVSHAFVAVGIYCLKGIPNSKVAADPARALEMFHYAATNFGNPNAQYNLARMYLDGIGVTKDPAQAARWLNLAADKNHAPAQALLGHLLFNGQPGIASQKARGLMWLTIARESTAQIKEDAWVGELYEKAIAAASDNDRQAAATYLGNRMKKAN